MPAESIAALEKSASTAAKSQPSATAGTTSSGPSNTSLYDQDIGTVQSDLNSNNFTGAWNTALQSSGLFDKGQSYSQATDQATNDPLLQAMEGNVGALDPSKNWTAAQTSNFYNAFNAEGAYHGQNVTGQGGGVESLGKNPYGLWGSASAITSGADAKANETQGGDTPDVSRFVGAHPTTSFLGKYGSDIAALALTAVTMGAAAPLAGAMFAGSLATSALGVGLAGAAIGTAGTAAIDAGFGKPLTAGSLAGGALSGLGASGALGGIGNAVGQATGLGSTAGGALVGAGVGAAGSALNHGNIGLGALAGGIGGAIKGSGVVGQAGNAVGSATGLGSTAGGALVGAGVGAAGSALSNGNIGLGALAGGVGGAIKGSGVVGQAGSAINSATGIPTGLASAAVGAAANMGTNYALGSLAGSSAAPSSGARPMNAYVAPPTSAGASSGGVYGAAAGAAGLAAGAGAYYMGGQGTNGNMATSTDSTLASTITGALPGLLQAGVGSAGSLAASNAEQNADKNAITTQQNNLGNINNIWGTQQQTGQGANTALQSSLGLNGQTANPSNFLNMPGYQFAVQQANQATQRQAAAMGNAYTPNTAIAIGNQTTGMAMQDYNTYIGQLMGAAGLGTTANQGLQTANQTTANNVSQLQQNIGVTQAEGYTGVANSAGSLFSANGAGTGLINAAGNYFNGSGSGVSPMNYGGQNPNGTVGDGTSSDPYGANASQYNMTNPGNTTTGVDPSTGQPWGNEGVTTPTFDPNSVSMPSMLGISTTDTNFGGSIDYTGNGSGDISLGNAGNFLPNFFGG